MKMLYYLNGGVLQQPAADDWLQINLNKYLSENNVKGMRLWNSALVTTVDI